MSSSSSSRRHSVDSDNSEAKKMLKKAVQRRRFGLDGLQAAQSQLVRVLVRVRKMQDCLDEAFEGKPFLAGLAPDAPANIRRFNTYLDGHARVNRVLEHALELWMFTCGLKQKDNWVPLLVENMCQSAAAAGRNSVTREK